MGAQNRGDFMTKTTTVLSGALIGLGTLALATTGASAAIVCNGAGECWHAHHTYHYRPEWGLTVHPNNWRWGPADHYVWREHAGRGYWRNGVWVRF
jgi:hypothetical protein